MHKFGKPLIFICLILLFTSVVYAAEPNSYMQYQEPKTTSVSIFSTIAYIFSLIATFAIVIGLAYFSSRFIGQKFGQFAKPQNQKVLFSLSLGTNRSIFIVEIAGKVLVLGVTDHNISLLQEITDENTIASLRSERAEINAELNQVFDKQFTKLQQMTQKFPHVFNNFDKLLNKERKRRGN